MERETLKLALEALGKAKRQIVHAKVAPHECIGEAITAIKEALAQPAQEPVAVVAVNQSGGIRMEYQDGSAFDISKHVGQRFYTTPPQPAQEPVGEVTENTDNGFKCEFNQRLTAGTKLYTTPPKRPWVGLTNEDKHEIELHAGITEDDDGYIVSQMFKLTETKLKDKNNG